MTSETKEQVARDILTRVHRYAFSYTEAGAINVILDVLRNLTPENLAALTPQAAQSPWGADREAVARVIDPEAWRSIDMERRDFPADPPERWADHPFVRPSLVKADAILALPAPPGEAVERRNGRG